MRVRRMVDAEPGWRCRPVGEALPWAFVRELAEYGHLELLLREAADGDCPSADAASRLLRARGAPAVVALTVLRPFLGTDWAARAVEPYAEILADAGDVDAAVALLRPHAGRGHREAVEQLGALLVRLGRGEEVVGMLRDGLGDFGYPFDVVVELTRGLGHDEEVIGLLRGRRGLEGLLAAVLERSGRTERAIAVLSAVVDNGSYDIADAEHLADLLARHDPAALAARTTGNGGRYAAHRLARLHEEQGRVGEAVALLASLAARRRRKGQHRPNHFAVAAILGPVTARIHEADEAWLLAGLLVRHGRVDEAVAGLRRATRDDLALLRPMCRLLIGLDRLDEARAAVAEVVAEGPADEVRLRLELVEALAECGRHDQAIAELRADPGVGGGYPRDRLVALLASSGPPDEAIAMLGAVTEPWAPPLLATALLRADRPEDAIAVMRPGPVDVV